MRTRRPKITHIPWATLRRRQGGFLYRTEHRTLALYERDPVDFKNARPFSVAYVERGDIVIDHWPDRAIWSNGQDLKWVIEENTQVSAPIPRATVRFKDDVHSRLRRTRIPYETTDEHLAAIAFIRGE